MASTVDSGRQFRRSSRRGPFLLSMSALAFLFFLLSERIVGAVGAVVAAESHTAGAAGKAKTGLGAAGSDIITITSKNFKETVTEGTWFIKFYTDWCKHCQRLQPTWEELAKELKGKVNLGQVNCDMDHALCRRFHVVGYPTLVHVHNQRTRAYKKSRSKEALTEFALEGYKKQAAVSVLKSPFGPLENFKALIVQATMKARDFVLVQIETGTPMWMVCLSAVAFLVVVTVVVAVVIVGVKRPKQD